MQSEIEQAAAPKQSYFWSVFQISLASYCAGPMAGCYFLGKNFQQLGLSGFAKRCYFAGIVGTVLLTTIYALVPEHLTDRIPPIFIPIVTASLIVSFASYYQKELIKENISKGAKRFSYRWFFLMIISFLVIQVPVSLLYIFFLVFLRT